MKKNLKTYKKITYVFAHPDTFYESSKYPVIIFLHGAGTRGTDSSLLLGNPYFTITEKYNYNAVTFAPQCYCNSWFDMLEQLQDFIEFALDNPYVDTQRVYVMGASMGGYATWQIAMTRPDLFAAIVPICGGGMYWNAERLKNMGVWAFHGSDDTAVCLRESENMVNAVNASGGNAKLTVCEGVGHNSWVNAYSSTQLFDWLFTQKLKSSPTLENKFDNVKKFG